jgi:hypothetical protein
MNKFFLFLILGISIVSCKKDDGGSSVDEEIDISGLLTDATTNLILPAYASATDDAKALKSAKDAFNDSPSTQNLTDLKAKWETAYISWIKASPYNFGPAEEVSFKTILEDVNTFPADVSLIEQNIAAGELPNSLVRDSKGFAAIDYLLYHAEANSIVTEFDDNRKAYFSAVVDDIYTRINDANELWKGDYQNDFTSNTSTSAGGSLSLYYNEFVKSFESIKQFKLALPAGKQIGQTQIRPDLIETRYNTDLALTLIKTQMEITENIWYGKSLEGNDGVGFDDFLITLGEDQLITDTKSSIDGMDAAVDKLTNLADDLENNIENVEKVIEEMQKHTRYYKSDLSGVIGIAITFSDGDGD